MTCITIASWMLAVVGLVIVGLSAYRLKYTFDNNLSGTLINIILFLLSMIGVVGGIIILANGILPYIPCITITP
jgi:hypothetical protein